MKNYTLVSIVVITYNSSKYVLETLESIKRQSYRNIELLISDDGSTDNTCSICENWIACNRDRFENVRLITTTTNTGTANNCNRALKYTNGEWLKVIAGDDILDNNAILNYIEYVNNNPNINALFGQSVHFYGTSHTDETIPVVLDLKNIFFGDNVSAKRQHKILTKFFVGSGPAFFVKTEIVKKLGGYDTRFPLLEDYPLFIKLTKFGQKLYLFDKLTVYKRMYDDSVINTKDFNSIYTNQEVRCCCLWKEEYKHENMNIIWKLFHNYALLLKRIIVNNGNNKSIFICRLFFLLSFLSDPILWYSRILNIIEKTVTKIKK